MSKEKRLGRGLEALLGRVAAAQPEQTQAPELSEQTESASLTVSNGFTASAGQTATDAETSTVGLKDSPMNSFKTQEHRKSDFTAFAEDSPLNSSLSDDLTSDLTLEHWDRSLPEIPFAQKTSAELKTSDNSGRSSGKASKLRSDSSFLDGDPTDQIFTEAFSSRKPKGIDIQLIDANPFQPRKDFEEQALVELSESLKKHGMIHPVVVRQAGTRFQIIAGERRFRAAKMIGWTDIPAHVLIVNDREMAEIALTENLQRKDLNAIEKAIAFQQYIEIYGGSPDEIAQRLDLDISTVRNFLRLLELPVEIQEAVRRGDMSQGHARALLSLEEWEQLDFAQRIIDEGWSVRQVESAVKDYLLSMDSSKLDSDTDNVKTSPRTIVPNAQLLELEQQFRTSLGTKVKLSQNQKGKGKLVIQFNSPEEFERIRDLICR